jgi:hypothetical protein
MLRQTKDGGTRLPLGVIVERPDCIPMESRIIVQQENISAPCAGNQPVVADTVAHVAFADDQGDIGETVPDEVDGGVR